MENISKLNAAIYRNAQSIMNFKLRDLDIKSGQHDFFYVISKIEGISQKELSEHLYIGKSTTAKAVKSLVENGYVKRVKDQKDKRIYKLYLTDKGKEISFKIEATFLELVSTFSKCLSDKEEEQTLQALKKILNTLHEEKNKINSDID
ncbi:winged helix-turn-helix transcriptional regulator [Clostridium sp. PL3]|uniref:Winged helix-turn-helix transcriptional regulator n=1 Tax=Clostridium thailandense TaxID=2794346 RepID=A0A949WPU3_9CLOT|nr:MarR family winged helix-turn-helix transcriptional regulator [Clostridium thailandense]MBV7271836.1 winged helix-turn-helix transcriptional regulator [Clostridium thailandense]